MRVFIHVKHTLAIYSCIQFKFNSNLFPYYIQTIKNPHLFDIRCALCASVNSFNLPLNHCSSSSKRLPVTAANFYMFSSELPKSSESLFILDVEEEVATDRLVIFLLTLCKVDMNTFEGVDGMPMVSVSDGLNAGVAPGIKE